ncbi:hypothetical protein C2134_00565 [Chromobacterium sinusclupearum]|uniref:Uncharacterized protein n=1 Tax=Chromobacterium sinusclupearum TaxID=2077146 RepID=A0A2K4MU31_9NEIS|nr:hypothetical protein C2134_00565 [Chromobacterium sinusclupearum]
MGSLTIKSRNLNICQPLFIIALASFCAIWALSLRRWLPIRMSPGALNKIEFRKFNHNLYMNSFMFGFV